MWCPSPRVPGDHSESVGGHHCPCQWWDQGRYQCQQSTSSPLCWPEISPSSGLLDARKACLHPSEQMSYQDNKARARRSLQWSLISVQDGLQLAVPHAVLMEQGFGAWSLQTREGFLPKRLHSKAGTGYEGSTQAFLQLAVVWLWMLPTVFRRKLLGSYGQDCEAGFVILAVTVCTLRWPVWGSGLWLERVLITYTIMMRKLVED